MEDAGNALHLLRDVLELGDGTVFAIHVGCVRLVIRKQQKNLENRSSVTELLHMANRRRLHGNNRINVAYN